MLNQFMVANGLVMTVNESSVDLDMTWQTMVFALTESAVALSQMHRKGQSVRRAGPVSIKCTDEHTSDMQAISIGGRQNEAAAHSTQFVGWP